MKRQYKNNSSKSRGFQGIIKKLGQLLCYCQEERQKEKQKKEEKRQEVINSCRVIKTSKIVRKSAESPKNG